MTAYSYLDDTMAALDDILSASGEMLCVFDAEGRYRYISRPACERLVLDRERLVGRFVFEVGPPSPRFEQFEQLRAEVQRTGSTLRASCSGNPRDARSDRPQESAPRAYDFVLSPFRRGGRQDGPVEGVVCTIHEMAQRFQPEVTAHEAIERFQQTFLHAPIGMAMLDPEGRWLEVNDALCALTGYSRQSLLAMTQQDLTHAEDQFADLVYRRQLLDGEITSFQLEQRYVRSEGRIIWVLVALSLVCHDDGAPWYLIAQITDITARKDAEARSRLLADLVECSADAIAARDERGRIVYWNQAAERLLGFRAEEMLGSTMTALLPEGRLVETARLLAKAAGGQPVGPVDTVLCRRDGSHVEVSETVSPIYGSDGELTGFASVVRDNSVRYHRATVTAELVD